MLLATVCAYLAVHRSHHHPDTARSMASTPVELRSPDSAAAPSALFLSNIKGLGHVLWQADVGQGIQLSLADPAVLGMQRLSTKSIL